MSAVHATNCGPTDQVVSLYRPDDDTAKGETYSTPDTHETCAQCTSDKHGTDGTDDTPVNDDMPDTARLLTLLTPRHG